jgi:hypothetical protein
MPRWKALPEELDPQVKEFAGQLRRLVDRSGLGIAALADRTGYSRTSWERYLGGRLLAPKGAVVALAEVTGSNPVHLTTMWELAERAWSRAEMRHDRTMEAIRIAQARAALGEFGAAAPGAEAGGSTRADGGKRSLERGGATAAPGIAGPAGVSPTVPPQPTASDAEAREGTVRDGSVRDRTGHRDGSGRDVTGRYAAGRERVPRGGSSASAAGAPPGSDAASAGRPGPTTSPAPGAGGGRNGGGVVRRQLTMFLAGLVGVLAVIGAVFYLTGGDGEAKAAAPTMPPSPSVSADPALPPGVRCDGAGCTGKDAEAMGCSGERVTTARSVTVGTTVVEVRYSKTCGAAWGRITQAAQGDQVQVTVGTHKQTDAVTTAGDTIAYTPMLAVRDAGQATACVTLASGQEGCTK